MALDFNVDPYYDDFDQTKNFHRILFRPGRAVQARELTQAQSILQDQVTKFADNIFKQNSPVSGGQITTNFGCYYIKLQSTYNDVAIDITEWYDATTNNGLLIRNADGSVIAQVVQAATATGVGGSGDPDTLIVTYKTGNQFQDGDVIYDVNSNLAVQAIDTDATGLSSVVSISDGVFYVLGNFVQISASTAIVDKYDNTPSRRIGLNIEESIRDYIDDASLLDPAVGASNYQAPGADRYFIGLTLESRPIDFGDDQNFVELVRVIDGDVQKMVDGSVYNVIDDYFAKRDFETNGDYVVEDFKLTPKTNANTALYTLSVGKGLAYVHGYRTENSTPIELTSNRARTTTTSTNNPVFVDVGSYFFVDNVGGGNGSFFDVTSAQSVDIHCVPSANVNTTNAATYAATTIGSGYIRGLVYDHSVTNTNANTYVHKAYVHSIANKSPTANAVAGGSSTITFPGTYSTHTDAYIGVEISITSGPSAGDFRTITAYNGSTRVATVNQSWTVTPTTSSQFTLNFDTKDTESLVSVDSLTIEGVADINATSGKVGGISTGFAVLNNSTSPEMLFTIGSPYAASITDSSYTTQQVFRDIAFTSSGGGVTAQLSYEGSLVDILQHFGTPSTTLSADLVKQNFTIVVTDKGSNTLFDNGDIINWVDTGLSVSLDTDASIATFTGTSGSGVLPFTATIIAKVFVTNADNTSFIRKTKTLVTANTQVINTSGTNVDTWTYVDDSLSSVGQVYIQYSGLVTPGTKQSLYLSDVKRIVKIIDTGASGTLPIVGMVNSAAYDITNNYTFDNGQRDSFYDHASITLKPGAPQPKGNILVFLDYYQHSGGDGYFCINSYSNEDYTEIPTYSASSGTIYQLRDAIDFRPARVNAQVAFDYRFSSTGTSNYGLILPVDLTVFTTDYSHYLGRKDKLILSKDRTFQIIEGSPSLTPLSPAQPDGSLVVAELIHNPYTGFLPTEAPIGTVSDLSIEKVKHKRYTMEDIAGLETRINQIEYYTSLSMLEQKASSLQISDSYGLNRFKNGILVDDFSSFGTADTYNSDYSAAINRREYVMTATHDVKNFPLKSLSSLYSLNNLDSSVNLGYNVGTDGYVNYYTLPFTTSNVASQKFASRDVNVNPFAVTNVEGYVNLSPNVDNWVDTGWAPSLLITDKTLQIYQSSNVVNLLTAGDWKTVPGTTVTTSTAVSGGTQTTTTALQTTTNLMGAYQKIDNTYSLNSGYVTDITVLPYVRPQQIVVSGKDMLLNTNVNAFFDGVNVNGYYQKANVLELTGVSGTFKVNDIVGYVSSLTFYTVGRVIGVYQSSTTVRLYISADGYSSAYSGAGNALYNSQFDASGTRTGYTASGVVRGINHFSGRLAGVSNTTTISLNTLASANDSFYVGNTIYIVTGTGAGQSANITSYTGSTRRATLSTAITTTAGDFYSIGNIKTDETGSAYGVFNVPANTFHNGQRVFRYDNSVNQNPGTATTWSEGTFYAEGLQTTKQRLDFGASPAGAKNTFYVTTSPQRNVTSTVFTATPVNRDPVAQTFIISKDNYQNGLFLDSIKLFFRTKPTSDSSPITLSIVGTLNGYPTGDTLDHSIVTLSPIKVNVSETPHYLDSSTATEFKFNAPIYIQPEVLYAFILKSNSKEYTLWAAANGDTAVKSSTKNLPTDATPSVATKIAPAPYVGSLFLSQNAQTWTTDQNQSLMFVIDRCVFSTSATPTVSYSVPKKMPQRTLFNQSLIYYDNANNVSNTVDTLSNTNITVDAFNVTTTDFVPSSTTINYSYRSKLLNGTAAPTTRINPGKFGTPMATDIYLTDGKGTRALLANSDTSFILDAVLSTSDDAVSPVISDAGLSTYAIKWNINNCELSNSLITLANGGSNYNVQTTTVSISAPTGLNGTQAYAAANISGGIVQSVYITTPGSGYIQTPTITILDANTTPGNDATAIIVGETSKNGGNALARYVSKKVTLDQGFDSGDINVYLTAYRPNNTDINVYYKILNRNDTQKFEDGTWQLMTPIKNSGSKYSIDRNDLIEYAYAPGSDGVDQGYVTYTSSTTSQVYTTFSQFAIKVVLRTSDSTFVPVVNDIRAIALPPNVNTTF